MIRPRLGSNPGLMCLLTNRLEWPKRQTFSWELQFITFCSKCRPHSLKLGMRTSDLRPTFNLPIFQNSVSIYARLTAFHNGNAYHLKLGLLLLKKSMYHQQKVQSLKKKNEKRPSITDIPFFGHFWPPYLWFFSYTKDFFYIGTLPFMKKYIFWIIAMAVEGMSNLFNFNFKGS